MRVKIVTQQGTFEAEGERNEVASLYEVFGTRFSADGSTEEIAKRADTLRHGNHLFPPPSAPKATDT